MKVDIHTVIVIKATSADSFAGDWKLKSLRIYAGLEVVTQLMCIVLTDI